MRGLYIRCASAVALGACLVLGQASSAAPVSTQVVAPTAVPTQLVSVYDDAGISPVALSAFKTAAARMINGDFHRVWRRPYIRFGPGSRVRLIITAHNRLLAAHCPKGTTGCHYRSATGPIAYASVNDTAESWQEVASHELEEMFVDPDLDVAYPVCCWLAGARWRVEVADPVEDHPVKVNGVPIADFVHPAWYTGGPGRQDESGHLRHTTVGHLPLLFCPRGYAEILFNRTLIPYHCRGVYPDVSFRRVAAVSAQAQKTAIESYPLRVLPHRQ